MVDDAPVSAPRKRPLPLRILKWVGIALLSILALLLIVVFGINTDPGRRFSVTSPGVMPAPSTRRSTGVELDVSKTRSSPSPTP